MGNRVLITWHNVEADFTEYTGNFSQFQAKAQNAGETGELPDNRCMHRGRWVSYRLGLSE